ncbi:hypothetical protein GCM10010446_28810 [Streptomyces enissocaesilis]|uniref:Bacterial bifunctional deaminase-reductase C-terminal domain-containing protein n=1 Tax=Streptomyces enissocaesilis TaxID=332589 RepID=A0ABN3X7U8_9ACTN
MEWAEMRKLVYYAGVTLDGRTAGPSGEFDSFPVGDEQQTGAYSARTTTLYPETVPTASRATAGPSDAPNRRFDTVVMGLGTYRPPLDAGMTSPYAYLCQYVVSSTLEPDIDPDATVVPGDPPALVRELKQEENAGLDIWLCGGGKLAGALLPEIDELVVKSYALVTGAGIPAFDRAFDPVVFDVSERTAFPNGVTLTRLIRPYRPFQNEFGVRARQLSNGHDTGPRRGCSRRGCSSRGRLPNPGRSPAHRTRPCRSPRLRHHSRPGPGRAPGDRSSFNRVRGNRSARVSACRASRSGSARIRGSSPFRTACTISPSGSGGGGRNHCATWSATGCRFSSTPQPPWPTRP